MVARSVPNADAEFPKSQIRSHIGIAQNLLGPGPSSLVQVRSLKSGPAKRPIGEIFGFGAGPVRLGLACPYAMVRSKYQNQDFAPTPQNAIPNLVMTFKY